MLRTTRQDHRADGILAGLDLLSTRAVAPGTFATPSGPDLSQWPVYAAAPPALERTDAGPALIELKAGRRPPATPQARLVMGRGGLDWQASAVEFGRRYRGGQVGLAVFFEKRAGAAPVPGGACDLETVGGSLSVPITGRWAFDVSVRRFGHDRWLPAEASDPDSLGAGYRAHDVSLSGTDGRSRVEIFHSTARLDADLPNGERATVASSRDGVAARFELRDAPIDVLDVTIASRRARGALLSEKATELETCGYAARTFDVGWRLSLRGGWSQLGEHGFPAGSVAVSPFEGWTICAFADGRHATAVERLSAPVDVAGEAAGATIVGESGIAPERALGLSGSWRHSAAGRRLGARAEVARMLGPVALRTTPVGISPANADDETTAALSLWASLGDTSMAGARLAADLFSSDESGAVLSRAPAPAASFAASGWLARRLFGGGYLDARLEVSLSHVTGLARGPWKGRLPDATTTASAVLSARADCARVYLLLEDLFDEAATRLPGFPGAGRRLSAGFSWSFAN